MPSERRSMLRNGYTNKCSGLDTIININGLYYIRIPQEKVKEVTHTYDTIYNAFIFYPNGFFEITTMDIIMQKEYLKGKKPSYFKYGEHGFYKVVGDTIKARYVEPPGGMTWYAGETWFKIINENTIEVIVGEARSLNYMDATRNYICNFKELSFIPPYNKSWLIRKKWFWENEEDFKQWKKKNKKIKIINTKLQISFSK